jgi:transposase
MARNQKRAGAEQRTIVYVDQAAFYLLPGVVRTYAPRGQTPILRAPKSYDHLSVMSGVTEKGRLYVRYQEKAYTGEAVVDFLKHLLRHIPGKLLVVWDGARIHWSAAVKTFLATIPDQRLHLVRIPAYAPELNPDEGIWRYLKYVELRNVVCKTLDELRYERKRAVARLRHKADVLGGLIRQTGL